MWYLAENVITENGGYVRIGVNISVLDGRIGVLNATTGQKVVVHLNNVFTRSILRPLEMVDFYEQFIFPLGVNKKTLNTPFKTVRLFL